MTNNKTNENSTTIKSPSKEISPAQIKNWSISQVLMWLTEQNIGHLNPAFFTNEIDGDLLLQLNDDILLNDLNVEKEGDRTKILNFTNQFKTTQKLAKFSQNSQKLAKISQNKLAKKAKFSFSWGESIKIGTKIDCQDTVGNWTSAVVLSIDGKTRSILVHFHLLPSRWDEWIFSLSQRIQPYSSKSCPTPLSSLKMAFSRESMELSAVSSKHKNLDTNLAKNLDTDLAKNLAKNLDKKELNYYSAYTPKSLKHSVSDGYLFNLVAALYRANGWVSVSVLEEFGFGRLRGENCFKDYLAKYVGGEVIRIFSYNL